MDEHKIKVFCAVAETKSFSKASTILRLTQPAVSLQIQALEENCGTKLFDRSRNTIVLTQAGKILYKFAKEINSLYTAADKDMSKFIAPFKGIVTVGASSTIGNYVLPVLISEFKKKNPKINVRLIVGNTKTIVDSLNEGIIDVALVEGNVKKQKLSVEKLMSDEMVPIFSPQHPWAKRSTVSILEVKKEPFISREEGSGTRQLIEKFFIKHGIHPQNIKIPFIMGSTESIKGAVEEGLGISIISKWAARKELKQGRLKKATFKEDKIVRDFSIIYPKSKDFPFPLFKFLEYVRKFSFDKLLK
ncbi:LysR family transcriptional regulator [bacterium]|nr:MAG: LysR family transcriptional regulator [bacterium]